MRGELEGKRNPELTTNENESNITLAKEAAIRIRARLPKFKDGTDMEELAAAYSPIFKSSEPAAFIVSLTYASFALAIDRKSDPTMNT